MKFASSHHTHAYRYASVGYTTIESDFRSQIQAEQQLSAHSDAVNDSFSQLTQNKKLSKSSTTVRAISL